MGALKEILIAVKVPDDFDSRILGVGLNFTLGRNRYEHVNFRIIDQPTHTAESEQHERCNSLAKSVDHLADVLERTGRELQKALTERDQIRAELSAIKQSTRSSEPGHYPYPSKIEYLRAQADQIRNEHGYDKAAQSLEEFANLLSTPIAHSEPVAWRNVFADGSKGKFYTTFPIPPAFTSIELAYTPHPAALAEPIEVTPEMLRVAQLHSELGAYACANLSGGYELITELFGIMAAATQSPQPIPATLQGDES